MPNDHTKLRTRNLLRSRSVVKYVNNQNSESTVFDFLPCCVISGLIKVLFFAIKKNNIYFVEERYETIKNQTKRLKISYLRAISGHWWNIMKNRWCNQMTGIWRLAHHWLDKGIWKFFFCCYSEYKRASFSYQESDETFCRRTYSEQSDRACQK